MLPSHASYSGSAESGTQPHAPDRSAPFGRLRRGSSFPSSIIRHDGVRTPSSKHTLDALTGAGGCEASTYMDTHWEYVDQLEVEEVDVEAIDPGIQDHP